MKLTNKYLLLAMTGVICVALMFPASVLADSITPETFSDVIKKGDDTSVKRTVTITEKVTSAKVDIFFLFDTTGSMGELLDSTKAKATDILNNASKLGDVAFGVGYYEDFPTSPYGGSWDVAYELVRDITTSSSVAQNAINSLGLGYGNDWPEANLYALARVASSTSWRENSTRIIIWFGDAVGHDGDLEPGYPSRVGLDDVISALNNKDIIVEAVDICDHDYVGLDQGFYDSRHGDDFRPLSGQATEITSRTGGKLFDGSDTSSIVAIINNALKDAFADYSEVTLELSREFSGLGVSISPARHSGNFDRSQERRFEFDITYSGLETGTYRFDLLAKVDGGVVAVANDTIEVKYQDCNGDWNGTAVLDECGECVGGNTGKTACVQDCNGEWGGSASVDDCGECVGGNTGKTSTCVQDCNGDWKGTAFVDECGECVGGNTGKTSTCTQDCNGEWDGTASLDECGECVGGNTGNTACVQDCNGDWGGTASVDECGECVGGATGKTACAQDCNGDWNGTAFTDECGECVGGNTGETACAQDCNEIWGGTAFIDDCGECVGGNTGKTACGVSNKGIFTVGKTGKITIDWLYDGGSYNNGELGIFSLSGMDMSVPDLTAFVTEAVTRALSGTTDGYVVLSDSTEAARFDGSLGEARNWNSGTYMGVKTFDMRPGDKFALILVPNASLKTLSLNPETTDRCIRPLFSFTSPNADYGMHVGQVADINDMGLAFVIEDLEFTESDLDYNDLILQISGGISEVPSMDSLISEYKAGSKKRGKRDRWRDWRTSDELGRLIIEHIETLPSSEYKQISVSLEGSADVTVFDSLNRAAGKDGTDMPGSLIQFDEGYQTVTLPARGTGSDDYRVVIRSSEAETGRLTLKLGQGNSEIPSEVKEIDIHAREVLKSDLSVSSQAGDLNIEFGDAEIPVAQDGTLLIHDFNGDGKIDDADITKVASLWDTCEGDPEYDPFFDQDGDGRITILDIMAVSAGKSLP
ncbi:DUF4114 domain-containing protein [Desulfonema magnum]|uniref:Dockerin domain-containing protein, DUF4114 n=1 Tax=Desulfonema magnum TaxID=45655 RepID=A0A975BFB9_9BACT|nr:DUF4114 domain-containing protein [Desulfonema magnum]QTA84709.1 Dockerin domain-containing protein, DUF4114 [Desulfonema magnum]